MAHIMQIAHYIGTLLAFFGTLSTNGVLGSIDQFRGHGHTNENRILPIRRKETLHTKYDLGPQQGVLQLSSDLTTNIKIGNQGLPVSVDTQYSGIWLVTSNYTCVNGSDVPQQTIACNFSNTYVDQGLLSFQSGPYALRGNGTTGLVAADMFQGPVAIAGLNISSLDVLLVYETTPLWPGYGGAGALGLGSPWNVSLLTEAPPLDTTVIPNQVSLMLAGQIVSSQSYSILLNRGPNNATAGGWLWMGMLPDDLTLAAYNVTVNSATTSLDANNWTVSIDSILLNPSDGSDQLMWELPPFAIASRSPYNNLPHPYIDVLYKLYNPAPRASDNIWFCQCNSTAVPKVSINIGVSFFEINEADMINNDGKGNCQPAFQPGDPLLGQPFLKNVVATWNVTSPTALSFTVQSREYDTLLDSFW